MSINAIERIVTDPRAATHVCRFCATGEHEEPVAQSATATAFPSLGAFIEGWTLVVPRKHVVALSELSLDEWAEFEALLRQVVSRVEDAYGAVVLFEHGSAGIGRTAGCGVDHAHMHVVPWAGTLQGAIADVPDLPTFEWAPSGLRPFGLPGLDYIWISDRSGSWITHDASLPSQVVRQALSLALHVDQWDWKADLKLEVAAAARRRLGTTE